MATSEEIETLLGEAVKAYLAEFDCDGYTVGTFFAFAARALLSVPTGSPLWLQRESEAYGHCVALAAEQAWRVVEMAAAMKRNPAMKSPQTVKKGRRI